MVVCLSVLHPWRDMGVAEAGERVLRRGRVADALTRRAIREVIVQQGPMLLNT